MQIYRHRNFKKQYKKLHPKIKQKFKERVRVFMDDPYHSVLNNHALGGDLKDYRSIDVTGNIRAWYETNGDVVTFVKIGSHSELYG